MAISALICSTGIKNLYVRRHEVDIENNVAIRKLICDPKSVTVDCHADFLKALDSTYICPGNPDLEFVQLCMSRKSQFKSKSGEVTAHLDSYSPFVFQDRQYSQTVRATSCLLLVKSAKRRCSKCASFRSALRVLRRSASAGPVNKYTPNAIMRTPVLRKKLADLASKRKSDMQSVRRLRSTVRSLLENQGVTLEDNLSHDVDCVMKSSQEEIEKLYPEGSFRRLFWDEQLKAQSVKGKQGRRWHPLILRWALNLKMRSSGAYHDMQSAGFITLPSERTLRDYTHFFRESSGFQVQVNDLLAKEASVSSASCYQKNVVLVFYEMRIREDLVFDKHEEIVLGFVDLGKVENQLLELERSVKKGINIVQEVASHLLVLMVRGIATSLRFRFAHFSTSGATSVNLSSILWEAVQHIEMSGLHVVAMTADGASQNRKFFKMCSIEAHTNLSIRIVPSLHHCTSFPTCRIC